MIVEFIPFRRSRQSCRLHLSRCLNARVTDQLRILPLLNAGVAYVKYDRASAAALAIENLHEVTLNDGQGPRLKVMLADSPHSRYVLWRIVQRNSISNDSCVPFLRASGDGYTIKAFWLPLSRSFGIFGWHGPLMHTINHT